MLSINKIKNGEKDEAIEMYQLARNSIINYAEYYDFEISSLDEKIELARASDKA